MAGVATGLSRLFKTGGLEVRYSFFWKQRINRSLHEFWLKDVTLYHTLSFLSSWEAVGAFLQCYCLPMGPISMESELCWKKSISQKKVRVKLERGLNWTWDISNVRWEEARSGQSFEVTNPATGEVSWRLNPLQSFTKQVKSVLVRIWSLNSGSLLCTWHVNRGHSGLTHICLKLILSPFLGSNWGGALGFSDLAAYHCQRKVCSAQLNCAQLVYIQLLGVIRVSPQTRSNLLRAWYNLCVTHQQELARILTAEQGIKVSYSTT